MDTYAEPATPLRSGQSLAEQSPFSHMEATERNTKGSVQFASIAILPTLQTSTRTGTNSGLHRAFSRDLTASSATNFPITRARFRLVVMWMGVGSTRCTY